MHEAVAERVGDGSPAEGGGREGLLEAASQQVTQGGLWEREPQLKREGKLPEKPPGENPRGSVAAVCRDGRSSEMDGEDPAPDGDASGVRERHTWAHRLQSEAEDPRRAPGRPPGAPDAGTATLGDPTGALPLRPSGDKIWTERRWQ